MGERVVYRGPGCFLGFIIGPIMDRVSRDREPKWLDLDVSDPREDRFSLKVKPSSGDGTVGSAVQSQGGAGEQPKH